MRTWEIICNHAEEVGLSRKPLRGHRITSNTGYIAMNHPHVVRTSKLKGHITDHLEVVRSASYLYTIIQVHSLQLCRLISAAL